ncbi:MAG: pitrilysin family protein [Patescibacteria group bacterium]
MLSIHKTILPNKLRVIVAPMSSIESVSVFITIRAGSRFETIKNNGIAHFLEHMFFKGGDRYKTPYDVAAAVDAVGGEFNAWTSPETVGYYIKVAKENISLAFDVLSDMLLNSKFKDDDIAREKGVIVEEYNMYRDIPRSILADEFQELMYGEHPLGRKVLGDMKFIRSVSKKDFVDYRKQLYTASNVVVSVAGNTSMPEVKKLISKYLILPGSGKKNTPIPYKSQQPPKPKIKIINKKTEQAHLILGVPALSAQDARKYVADIIAVVLGGGMSSRLFTSIRERHGLAYYVNATHDNYADAGDLTISAGVNIKKIDLAIQLIIEELKNMMNSPISAEELKKNKEDIIGQLVLRLERSDFIARGLANQELIAGKVETIKEIKRKYRAVTAEQVQKLAKNLFETNNIHLAVIGPYTDKAKFVKLIK